MIDYNYFYQSLKEKGYKVTNQRKIIIETMLENQDRHLTTEELHRIITKKHPEIGLATVYRNVKLLCDLNIIDRLNLDDGFVRYEVGHRSKTHRHHHLICTNCNKVIEVKEDLMDSIERMLLENYGFQVSDHETKFYGLCQDCRAKK